MAPVVYDYSRQQAGLNARVGQFTETVNKYVAMFQLGAQDAVAKIAFELEGRIKERTPVDTGRLRSSIHTVVWGKGRAFSYSAASLTQAERRRVRAQAKAVGARPPKIAQGNYDGTLKAVPRNAYEAVVGTNVKYAQFIEFGTKFIPARAMFRTGLMSLRGALGYAVAQETRRRAQRKS